MGAAIKLSSPASSTLFTFGQKSFNNKYRVTHQRPAGARAGITTTMASQKELHFPQQEDLLSQIRFDSENGKIWYNEQRMLLIHSSVMGLLRKELVETVGVERARGFLMSYNFV